MDLDPSILWDFAGEVVGSVRPSARRVPATVTRVDADGTVWVTTGDGTEAPAATCGAGVSVGDVVSVEWSGAQMGVTGNVSDPSAGSRAVGAVQRAVRAARSVADGAQAIANAIGQHFWADDNGAHVSTEADNAIGARNILMNSLGILLRQEGTWLASFSDSAVAFFDGLGNTAANVVATFGLDGARIGRESESHMLLDYHSMQMVDKEGSTYFHVSDLRGSDGYVTIDESFTVKSARVFTLDLTASEILSVKVNGTTVEYTSQTVRNVTYVTLATQPASGATLLIEYKTADRRAKAYTIGLRATGGKIGALSVATGIDSTASGIYSHSEGRGTTASNDACHAEGMETVASGLYSHAEGYASQATGDVLLIGSALYTAPSHAEGYSATASNGGAHAEGGSTTASGGASHAEGFDTTASGDFSHAEGAYTTASGKQSHAQNDHTVAAYDSQTAIGKYNDNQSANAFEIGNGTSNSARSNAFAVDWSGNVTAAGGVTAAGDVSASGDMNADGDLTASGNLTAGNFRDAAMTRDLGSSGTVRACRIGSMVVMSGVLGGCTVSDTYTWTHLAHLDPADLGVTSVTSMGATVEVSGGGPSYAGTTNAGGTARIVDGVLYAEMQTSAAFSAKYVKFVITAYVE